LSAISKHAGREKNCLAGLELRAKGCLKPGNFISFKKLEESLAKIATQE